MTTVGQGGGPSPTDGGRTMVISPRAMARRAQPPFTRVTTFSHDGLTLVVKQLESAVGRPFVLVPGIGVASRYFGPLAAALGEHGPVYVVELPGMGDAPEPRNALPLSAYGGLVATWMADWGLVDAVIVGHSMGTQVVTEAVLADPRIAAGVVLIGAVTNPREASTVQQALRLAQDTLRERIDVNWIVATDYVKCGPRWMLKQAPVMVRYPMLERAAGIPVPTLVMRGDGDPISPHRWNLALARAIPDARFETLDGQAHVGMYTDAPTAARLITGFAADAPHDASPGERGEHGRP